MIFIRTIAGGKLEYGLLLCFVVLTQLIGMAPIWLVEFICLGYKQVTTLR